MPGTTRSYALVALLVTVGATDHARAENPHLERARTKKLALDYEAALESLRLARAAGNNDPETLAEIFRLRGEIQAGLGQTDAATESFQHLLALDPAFGFPAGTSPKVLEPYHLARAFLSQRGPLRVHFEPAPGASPAVRVIVESDPLGMVRGAAARYRLPDGTRGVARAAGTSELRVTLPHGDEIAVIAWVFDEHGNRLRSVGAEAAPLWVRVGDRGGGGRRGNGGPTARPLYARWYTWASAAALATVAGSYFGLAMRDAERDIEELNDTSDSHDFSETQPIADRGRRDALLANISFAVAGGAAIVAGILLVRNSRRDRRAPGAAVTPLLTPDSAGLAVAVEF